MYDDMGRFIFWHCDTEIFEFFDMVGDLIFFGVELFRRLVVLVVASGAAGCWASGVRSSGDVCNCGTGDAGAHTCCESSSLNSS